MKTTRNSRDAQRFDFTINYIKKNNIVIKDELTLSVFKKILIKALKDNGLYNCSTTPPNVKTDAMIMDAYKVSKGKSE